MEPPSAAPPPPQHLVVSVLSRALRRDLEIERARCCAPVSH
jgi:hypothetical protein